MATKKQSLPSTLDVISLMEGISKKMKLSTISITSEDRVSSGLLCMDLMLGGGLAPAWVTWAGPEQSAKTTFALQALMQNAENENIPIKILWDAEQSTGQSMDYVSNIFEQIHGSKKASGVDHTDIFGARDKKGKYVVQPKVYYRDDVDGEKFFNWTFTLFNSLPDKRQMGDSWYYVYEVTQENKSKFKGQYDVNLSSSHGGLWVKAADGSPQVMILVDSLPSLVAPMMMQEESSNQLGQQAGMFSKHIPRIKGMFGSKRIVLMAINQLRTNPGARFSNPLYEPGGSAPQYFSDVRLWFWPNALSTAPFSPKGEGLIETEASLGGGEDQYRYIKVSVKKNKLSAHVKETWLRLWVQNDEGRAMGFDPVWDVFWYGQMTGQIVGNRKKMTINIEGYGESKIAISWADLKAIVMDPKEAGASVFKKMGLQPVNIRQGFRRQVASGEGYDLLIQKSASDKKRKASKVDADDDEGDDE